MRYREPRQPERERGFLVYTTETPPETRTKGALASFTVTQEPAPKPKEETMSRRRSNPLPYGAKMLWVNDAVVELQQLGHTYLNAQAVYNQMPVERKSAWLKAYRTMAGARSAIISALNAILHSTQNGIKYERIDHSGDLGRYVIVRNAKRVAIQKKAKEYADKAMKELQQGSLARRGTDGYPYVTEFSKVGDVTINGTDYGLYRSPDGNIGVMTFTELSEFIRKEDG